MSYAIKMFHREDEDNYNNNRPFRARVVFVKGTCKADARANAERENPEYKAIPDRTYNLDYME